MHALPPQELRSGALPVIIHAGSEQELTGQIEYWDQRGLPLSRHLIELDCRRREIQRAFPDWVIWYWVDNWGTEKASVVWHARPMPEIKAASPEELVTVLRACEAVT